MSQYVLAFRAATAGAAPSAAVEQQWADWFGVIGAQVVDWGNRAGQVRALGTADGSGNVLGGYIVITAEDFDRASEIASGCPAITHGGGVEVAEIVTS